MMPLHEGFGKVFGPLQLGSDLLRTHDANMFYVFTRKELIIDTPHTRLLRFDYYQNNLLSIRELSNPFNVNHIKVVERSVLSRPVNAKSDVKHIHTGALCYFRSKDRFATT